MQYLEILSKETRGKRYRTHRYCHDAETKSVIEYEAEREVEWKNFGETSKPNKPIDLSERARKIQELQAPSIFSYFLDGSRHTYKVDDVMYNKQVYPIIAGQIGVGCCKRVNKNIKNEFTDRKFMIVIPQVACRGEWGIDMELKDLLEKINQGDGKLVYKLKFDKILRYSTSSSEDTFEKKGIAVIQDEMVALEQKTVAGLSTKGKLNQDNYLIKDGSLEYKPIRGEEGLKSPKVKNYYKYVIGVSKSFNPTKCIDKAGNSNSDIIAGLNLFERTPAYMYKSRVAGDAYFVIWYVRIRAAKYTKNIFDGILKIEKIITNQREIEDGVNSDIIDNITSHIINERNPTCYGLDDRWANHLYPVYLTERYVKSKYISNSLFIQLF